MLFKNDSRENLSAELEELVIKRFRELTTILPRKCLVFRKIKNREIVLTLDFSRCRQEVSKTMEESVKLTFIVHKLRLAEVLEFKINRDLIGWTNVTKSDYSTF